MSRYCGDVLKECPGGVYQMCRVQSCSLEFQELDDQRQDFGPRTNPLGSRHVLMMARLARWVEGRLTEDEMQVID
jgi:hypothetical protein